MPELIENLHERIGNHPQVVNLPIYNNTFLVPDHNQAGEKGRVSKLILQILICELHNGLISEINIYQFKEAIDEITGKPLISDTALRATMHKNVRKMTDRYKYMCGCKIYVIICSMQASLNCYRLYHLNLLR